MHTLHNRFEMEQSDWSFQHSSSAKLFVHSFTRPSFWVRRRETSMVHIIKTNLYKNNSKVSYQIPQNHYM